MYPTIKFLAALADEFKSTALFQHETLVGNRYARNQITVYRPKENIIIYKSTREAAEGNLGPRYCCKSADF